MDSKNSVYSQARIEHGPPAYSRLLGRLRRPPLEPIQAGTLRAYPEGSQGGEVRLSRFGK